MDYTYALIFNKKEDYDKAEQNRISASDKDRLESKIKGFEIRELERVDYKNLLPSMTNPGLIDHKGLDEGKDVV